MKHLPLFILFLVMSLICVGCVTTLLYVEFFRDPPLKDDGPKNGLAGIAFLSGFLAFLIAGYFSDEL
jgi:hypothetical protein